jgi:hypothetical protein
LEYTAIAGPPYEHGSASMAAPTGDCLALGEIWPLRLLALFARAHGDAAAYAHLRDHTRGMGKTLGFEGVRRGSHTMARRAHRACGHTYSPESSRVRRSGGRGCVECVREDCRPRHVRRWAPVKEAG